MPLNYSRHDIGLLGTACFRYAWTSKYVGIPAWFQHLYIKPLMFEYIADIDNPVPHCLWLICSLWFLVPALWTRLFHSTCTFQRSHGDLACLFRWNICVSNNNQCIGCHNAVLVYMHAHMIATAVKPLLARWSPVASD